MIHKTDLELIAELQDRVSTLTQANLDLSSRLQAIDHAYNEQQRSENKTIAEQRALITRQRKFIRTLYTSRKARKSKGSTSAQSVRENAPKAKSGGNAGVSKGNPCMYCDGLGYIHCNGGRPTAPCPNGCQ